MGDVVYSNRQCLWMIHYAAAVFKPNRSQQCCVSLKKASFTQDCTSTVRPGKDGTRFCMRGAQDSLLEAFRAGVARNGIGTGALSGYVRQSRAIF